jgi:hypothetical protein
MQLLEDMDFTTIRKLEAYGKMPIQNKTCEFFCKKLCNHIADNVWHEKEYVRTQNKLTKIQKQRRFS